MEYQKEFCQIVQEYWDSDSLLGIRSCIFGMFRKYTMQRKEIYQTLGKDGWQFKSSHRNWQGMLAEEWDDIKKNIQR